MGLSGSVWNLVHATYLCVLNDGLLQNDYLLCLELCDLIQFCACACTSFSVFWILLGCVALVLHYMINVL